MKRRPDVIRVVQRVFRPRGRPGPFRGRAPEEALTGLGPLGRGDGECRRRVHRAVLEVLQLWERLRLTQRQKLRHRVARRCHVKSAPRVVAKQGRRPRKFALGKKANKSDSRADVFLHFPYVALSKRFATRDFIPLSIQISPRDGSGL